MDLQLENGDLVLSNVVQQDEATLVNLTIYDLVQATEEDELHTLLKRVFVTPLGYLRLRVLDQLGTRKIDYDYGNGIYMTLSQPVKTTLIEQIDKHIANCIGQLPPPIRINKYQIQLTGIDSVQVRINYSLKPNETNETTIVIEV